MFNVKDKHQKIWLWILLILMIGILFLGLRPKNFKFENGVTWLKGESGVRFSDYGLAFAKPFIKQSESDAIFENGFTIEFSFKSMESNRGNFGFLFSIHDGKDRNQLIAGQWRSHIIVMNGDDYSHKRKDPRISVDTAFQKGNSIFMSITTGKQGTRIYIDGHIAKSDSKLILRLPEGENTRLTLGNSVYGNNSWEGEIHGLALYGRGLTDDEAASHFEQWSAAKSFMFAEHTNRPCCTPLKRGRGHKQQTGQETAPISRFHRKCGCCKSAFSKYPGTA